MSQTISYYAISRDELDRLVSRASKPELITAAYANQAFSISEGMLLKMEKEGRIKSVDIPGTKKMRRWRYEEVRELWKQNQTI